MKCRGCQTDLADGSRFCAQCGAAAPSSEVSFGDYEVQALIAEGGMGRVYRALQTRLNRTVCIKTIKPRFASDPEVVQRLAREATTMASLKHPNIVAIHDLGTTADGTFYIVMEFVDGRTLSEVIRSEAPIPAPRAVSLIDQVLAGLAEAHAHKIIHRDLKPSNVLVVPLRDGSELCKVLDFGIARSVENEGPSEDRLTREGLVMGTPGYMAPEQATGGAVDQRADLYAAGVILYEMLVGQRMFRAASELELMHKAVLEDPPPPSTRTSASISVPLDVVVLRAVTKDRSLRFQSATEFRDALGAIASSASRVMVAPLVEYTPLAVVIEEQRSDLKPLIASALRSEAWEHHRFLEKLESLLRNVLSHQDAAAIHEALTYLHGTSRDVPVAQLKSVVEMLKGLFLEFEGLIFDWLQQSERHQLGLWMLRILGRKAIEGLLKRIPDCDDGALRVVDGALRTIEPSPGALFEVMRLHPPEILGTFLRAVRAWPDGPQQSFLTLSLNCTSVPHRLVALSGLDENLAFRSVALVRTRLHDPNPGVRKEALRWVVRLEDQGAVAECVRLLDRSSTVPEERRAILEAAARLGEAGMALVGDRLAKEKELEIQMLVIGLLGRSKQASAEAALRSGVANKVLPRQVRHACTDELRKMGVTLVPPPSAK